MAKPGNALIFFVKMHPEIQIDMDDLIKLSFYTAYIGGNGYVYLKYEGTPVLLHRLIMGLPEGEVDHRNQDRLDVRKENLRVATRPQNSFNKQLPAHNKSGYKGVSWDKLSNRWVAKIEIEGRQLNLGRYKEKEEAALAYNKAALKYHREFASLNQIP